MRGGLGRTLVGAVGAVVVVAVVAAGYLLYVDRPSPPGSLAGATAFARTSLQPADPRETLPPGSTVAIRATECLPRVTNGTAWVDLCWIAFHELDEDPGGDHYSLHLGGTFGGGARWIIVEAHPLDAGPLLRTEGLPDGRTSGCQRVELDSVPFVSSPAGRELCGRIDAGPGSLAGVWHLNWSCEPCLPFDKPDRPILMELEVVVEEGTVPNWDLYADLGY